VRIELGAGRAVQRCRAAMPTEKRYLKKFRTGVGSGVKNFGTRAESESGNVAPATSAVLAFAI